MTADLQNPIFTDANAAREALEAVRWPNGAVCPHCGSTGDDVARVETKSARPGLFYCNGCKGQFTVTVGTVFERSKIPLNKWWLAAHLLNSSKKGISAHQMHRMMGVTYKTAWFMSHRIREAMRPAELTPMGGDGKTVEIDETYIGKQEGHETAKGSAHKNIVFTLVERGGRARSFHIGSFTIADVVPIVRQNVRRESALMSDEAPQYRALGKEFASHGAVNHGNYEWVRGEVSTNTVEGYYSIFKRGMKGIYQHCAEKHLHRYLSEFDFRYSNRVALGVADAERADLAIQGAKGKRLTYRRPH